jgi:hypothetical protein
MTRARQIASILLLCILCHILALGYGYKFEAMQVVPPRVPGVMGGQIVQSRHFELRWTDLESGSMIAWSRGIGFTCDVMSTVRSPRFEVDPIVRELSDAAQMPTWSAAKDLMSDPSTPYDLLDEAAFGFPIRFLVLRQAFAISITSDFVAVPLPGDSAPAPRWDIHYGRLLASILLYLVPIWFVYGLYPRARRYLRRRRGCCGECAYSLKGLNTTTCPECGHVNEAMKARTPPRS